MCTCVPVVAMDELMVTEPVAFMPIGPALPPVPVVSRMMPFAFTTLAVRPRMLPDGHSSTTPAALYHVSAAPPSAPGGPGSPSAPSSPAGPCGPVAPVAPAPVAPVAPATPVYPWTPVYPVVPAPVAPVAPSPPVTPV